MIVRHFKANGPFLKTIVRGGQLQLLVRQATNDGYIACKDKGVFDAAYPTSELRRARVKSHGDVCGSIMAGDTSYCVFREYRL